MMKKLMMKERGRESRSGEVGCLYSLGTWVGRKGRQTINNNNEKGKKRADVLDQQCVKQLLERRRRWAGWFRHCVEGRH